MQSGVQAFVSVIVPIYNAEEFLDQCLESIRAQTYGNLEVICINDGSTDGSLEIMRRHAAQDERVRVIDKENGGYGAGCNRGLDEATGEWVAIVEPDDYIDPTMFEEMLAFAGRFEERIDIIKTPWWDLKDWDDPDRMKAYPSWLTGHVSRSRRPFTVRENPEFLAFHPSIWSALYRRAFLMERQIRFPEYPGAGWADNPFLIDTVCQAEAMVYYDRPFYRYRADLPGSTLNHATAELVMRPFERWLTMLDRVEELGVDEPRVLEALYRRGFTYVDGAIIDDGADNPLVVEGSQRVFGRMDQKIVLSSARISGRRKKLFCRVLGLSYQRSIDLMRLAYVVQDAVSYLCIYGPLDLMGRARGRLSQP